LEKKGREFSRARIFFLPRKEKTGIFLAAKNFTGPDDPDIFPKNPDPQKFHAEEKFGQSDVHPIIG